jgi:putative transposase
MAVMQRKPAKGLIFHSDRGSQYASQEFRKVLKQNKMIQSMSRKGNCWDNACAESFFSTLKMEEVFHQTYKTQDEARNSIFEYIAVYYNRQRRHSTIGYMCPDEYELKMGLSQKIA